MLYVLQIVCKFKICIHRCLSSFPTKITLHKNCTNFSRTPNHNRNTKPNETISAKNLRYCPRATRRSPWLFNGITIVSRDSFDMGCKLHCHIQAISVTNYKYLYLRSYKFIYIITTTNINYGVHYVSYSCCCNIWLIDWLTNSTKYKQCPFYMQRLQIKIKLIKNFELIMIEYDNCLLNITV